MRRKCFLALALAIALVGAAHITFTTDASSSTQASNSSQVKYGVVDEYYKGLLENHFDATYYARNNHDVVEVLGTDSKALFGHFIKCGLWEGRKGWQEFDPIAYASAYPDLREAFGNDILSYYIHYFSFGQAEGRTITTVEACIDNGIVLVSFFDDNAKKVDADSYYASDLLGTDDYDSVQEAVNIASTKNEPVVVNNASTGESYVIVPSGSCIPEGYEKLGTIKVNGDASVIIYKAASGYVAENSNSSQNTNPIANVTITVMSPEAYNSSISNSQLPDDYSTTGIPEDGNFVLDTGVQYAGSSSAYGDMTESDSVSGTNEGNLHITQYGEDYDFNIGIDENGTDDSTYDYGTVVNDNGDGTVTVTVVVTNPDTGMVHNETYTFSDGENQD